MTTISQIPAELEPGDLLLYGNHLFSNELVKWKEGDPDTDHIEVYLGNGQTFASRNGIGLDIYAFNPGGLVHVRRPLGEFDLASVMLWIPTVRKAPYGWGDIESTLNLSRTPHIGIVPAAVIMASGADCSDTAAMVMEIGQTPQIDSSYDKRKVTPRDFKLTRQSAGIWDAAPALAPAAGPDLSPRETGLTAP